MSWRREGTIPDLYFCVHIFILCPTVQTSVDVVKSWMCRAVRVALGHKDTSRHSTSWRLQHQHSNCIHYMLGRTLCRCIFAVISNICKGSRCSAVFSPLCPIRVRGVVVPLYSGRSIQHMQGRPLIRCILDAISNTCKVSHCSVVSSTLYPKHARAAIVQ